MYHFAGLAPRNQARKFMKVSFWGLALLVASSISCVSAQQNPTQTNWTPAAVVPNTTMTGKVISGYQGWFNAPNDGAGFGWRHFGDTPGNVGFDMWPDVSELDPDERFDTKFKLKDGKIAQLFSSYNEKTVLRHFKWMRDYGLDGVFLQRFASQTRSAESGGDPRVRKHVDKVLANVRKGAQQYGRVYGMMYDLSGVKDGDVDRIIEDWKYLVDTTKLTKDERYIRHNGKPVVALWGLGFTGGRDPLLDDGLKFVNFLKNDPVYGGNLVKIGVPWEWRTTDTARVPWAKMEKLAQAADIISPWAVGVRTNATNTTNGFDKVVKADIDWCKAHGKEYMPVVFPGFTWYNLFKGTTPSNQIPRNGGQFLWHQYLEAKRVGATMVYTAMFDEVDEGTAIFKVTNDVPPAQGSNQFVTLEGLPSDFYLKLVGQAGRLVRGEIKPEDDTLVKNAKWTPFVPELPVVSPVSIQTEEDSRRIKTNNYEAVVDADGAMPSLKINGQEFFSTSPGIPRGLYLFQKGLLSFQQIEGGDGYVLNAKNEKASLRYQFNPQSISITATNLSAEPMPYYAAFAPAITAFLNNSGQAVKTATNLNGQNTTTWFRGNARLKIEGGSSVFGPWGANNLQIWQAVLAADETRTVTLTAGAATSEELDILAKATGAVTNAPAPTDVAAPKLAADGTLNAYFKQRHETILSEIKQKPVGLLFIGDSITNRWNNGENKVLLDARFGQYNPINMGIEGDKTQHVLWRFENGELEGIKPKVAVVMIGTNNMGDPAEAIVRGDTKIVAELRRRLPDTKVLLLGIFPRGAAPTDGVRAKIKGINAELAKLDDGQQVRFLDFGDKFLEADGTISKDMMPDALHPNPKGYVIWADAITPLLDEMMR